MGDRTEFQVDAQKDEALKANGAMPEEEALSDPQGSDFGEEEE